MIFIIWILASQNIRFMIYGSRWNSRESLKAPVVLINNQPNINPKSINAREYRFKDRRMTKDNEIKETFNSMFLGNTGKIEKATYFINDQKQILFYWYRKI